MKQRSLLPLLVAILAPPVLAVDDPPAAKDGSHVLTCSVELEETVVSPRGNTHDVWKFIMEVYDIPGDKMPRRVLFVMQPMDDEKAPKLPLASILYRPDGKTRVDLVHPQERPVTDALIALVKGPLEVPKSRLKKLESGQDQVKLSGIRLDRAVPITYETKVSKKNPENLDYHAFLPETEGPVVSDYGSFRSEVVKLSERYIFTKDGHDLLGGRWTRKTVQSYSGRRTERETELQVVVQDRRPLSTDEVKSVEKQADVLIPVARACLPGFIHDVKPKELTESLKKFRDEHGSGLLASALQPLEMALVAKLPELGQILDPDSRAQGLLGKPAPDFKLTDLDGREVSLSQFRGDVILLEFWAYR